MKRLILILVMFSLVVPLQAQSFWGLWGNDEIEWGTAFKMNLTDSTSDSTQIVRAVTRVDSFDTMYTSLLYNKDETEGVFNIFIAWDSLGYTDSTTYNTKRDSIQLQVRKFAGPGLTRPWTDWLDIGGFHEQNQTFPYEYELGDSTWNRACRGWQFRTFAVDTSYDSTGFIQPPELSVFKY